jgi:hypothetical protein
MAIDGVAEGAFAGATDALPRWLYVECSFFTIYRVLLVGNMHRLRVVLTFLCQPLALNHATLPLRLWAFSDARSILSHLPREVTLEFLRDT